MGRSTLSEEKLRCLGENGQLQPNEFDSLLIAVWKQEGLEFVGPMGTEYGHNVGHLRSMVGASSAGLFAFDSTTLARRNEGGWG